MFGKKIRQEPTGLPMLEWQQTAASLSEGFPGRVYLQKGVYTLLAGTDEGRFPTRVGIAGEEIDPIETGLNLYVRPTLFHAGIISTSQNNSTMTDAEIVPGTKGDFTTRSSGAFIGKRVFVSSPEPSALHAATGALGALMVPVETGSDATSLSEMLVASQAEVAREVANLRQETDRRLRALDERVAALARTFGEVPDFTTGRLSLERFTNFTLEQLEGQLGSQYDGDEWTDLLEEAGDVGTPEDKALGAAALKGLGSNDPAVRGASARAILRIFPEHAQDALEEALAAERNPRVSGVLRSCIRALAA